MITKRDLYKGLILCDDDGSSSWVACALRVNLKKKSDVCGNYILFVLDKYPVFNVPFYSQELISLIFTSVARLAQDERALSSDDDIPTLIYLA